ncbi:MAG: DsbA family protein [Gammaproteobacteria bacterium]|nr:DsbA family protein [Gammaproteobacteria bacterium]
MDKPELKISIFSDYICPFCYIGHHRLQQLKQDYELKINWCFVEIHPETPAEGMPTTELDYNDEQWQGIVSSLNALIEQDQLPFKHEHQFTTNSHKALLLAEACKPLGADIFYRIHNRLFEAFFVDMLNIGDEAILRQIAAECDVPEAITESALNNSDELEKHLQLYLQYATKAQISGVPTIIIGTQSIPGVSSLSTLQDAALETLKQTDTGSIT